MIQRYLLSAAFAALVTFSLFALMGTLIDIGGRGKEESIAKIDINFSRVIEETQTQLKERKLPQKLETEKEPTPPEIDMTETMAKPGAQTVQAPTFKANVDVGGPGLGSIETDADILPLVRIPPQYPPRAQERGIEGWVHLRFTITKAGTVRDPEVVDADPPNVFDRAAIRAVERWKYKPRVENGVPVERPGVEVVLSFDLEDK